MANLGGFLKGFPDLSPLTGSTEFPIGDGSDATAYKTDLAAISAYIGSTPVTAPLILEDQDAYTTATGTISWTGATGAATVTDSGVHGDISVGDVILIGGVVSNVVIAKGSDPNLTVLSSYDISGESFSYGASTIITKDSSSNVTAVIAKGGVLTTGSILTNEASSFRNGIHVDGTVEVSDKVKADNISSYDGTVTNQENFDDGTIKYRYQSSFCAKKTSNQTIFPSWTKVVFNVANGTDTEKITHSRVPLGMSNFDTTNGVFVVPYDASYGPLSYSFTSNFVCSCNQGGVAGGRDIRIRLLGTSTATGTSGWYLEYQREHVYSNVLTYTTGVGISTTVVLDPYNNPNHRYIGVWLLHSYPALSILYANGGVCFSGVCNG